ncbi:MAG: FixH family protein [Cloacibacterium sp.]|jgi:hypothetical protein|nr:FixH family protein [Cloacibacterium sp.]
MMIRKFTWGHGIAVALALFMGFILYLIFIFPIGKQNSELVSQSYYDDELAYQQVIDAKNNVHQLSLKPQYNQTSEGIRVSFPQELKDAEKIAFHLYRTNDATLDIEKEITLDTNHSFFIPSKVLSKGAYTLKLSWKKNQKNYQIDYDVEWK